MLGVRFLDVDFIALKLPCSRLSGELIHIYCTVKLRPAAVHGRRRDQPLGAGSLYLGETVDRIHKTNQFSTIGTFVSSGCIRLRGAEQ
jgi:hypothetical protein